MKGAVGIDEYGSIVTGIAVAQAAGRQVEHADKECDKHQGVVVLADAVVEQCDDTVRLCLAG